MFVELLLTIEEKPVKTGSVLGLISTVALAPKATMAISSLLSLKSIDFLIKSSTSFIEDLELSDKSIANIVVVLSIVFLTCKPAKEKTKSMTINVLKNKRKDFL